MLFPNGVPRVHWLGSFLRSFVLRGALVYPPVFFLRYMAYMVNPLLGDLAVFAIVILLPYPLILSILESWMIRRT